MHTIVTFINIYYKFVKNESFFVIKNKAYFKFIKKIVFFEKI